MQLFGMSPGDFLGLSVVGAIVTTTGSLVALYLKEVLFARSFERWKTRQTLISVYRRYQVPIFLAAEELSNRLYALSRPDSDEAEKSIGVECLQADNRREAHAMVSDYYYQYRFLSNVYRLCSFLGWVELYRRDIGTLDVESLDRNHVLESCFRNIRSVLADGWINQHSDAEGWRDCLIFREELRAVGHRMVDGDKDLRLLDFGAFFETLRKDPNGIENARWFYQAALFFDRLGGDKDFRIVRVRMLVVFLTDLMEVLQPGRTKRTRIAKAVEWFEKFDQETGGAMWRTDKPEIDLVRQRLNRSLPHASAGRGSAR